MGFQRDDSFAQYPETLFLSGTATIAPMPGQIGMILKYVSGGSLSILGTSMAVGSTFGASMLYTLGTNEVMSGNICGNLRLQITGATCIANLMRMVSAGTSLAV